MVLADIRGIIAEFAGGVVWGVENIRGDCHEDTDHRRDRFDREASVPSTVGARTSADCTEPPTGNGCR